MREREPSDVIHGTLVRVTDAPRTKFDEVKKTYYIRLIRQGFRRYRAAEMVGLSYGTIARHMDREPDFARAVSEAEAAKIDEVEEALYETAIAGNVTAQQVVLYNRRSEAWADQRMIKSRLEAAQLEAERISESSPTRAVDGLRTKLLDLRDRLAPDVQQPEPEPVAIPIEETGAAS